MLKTAQASGKRYGSREEKAARGRKVSILRNDLFIFRFIVRWHLNEGDIDKIIRSDPQKIFLKYFLEKFMYVERRIHLLLKCQFGFNLEPRPVITNMTHIVFVDHCLI